MANNIILPAARAWPAVPREFYAFFQQVANSANNVTIPDLTDITQRVDALESASSGRSYIISGGSLRFAGSLPGNVYASLDGDEADPGNTQYYGSGPTGERGWFNVSDAIAGSDNVTLTVGDDGVTAIDLSTGVLASLALADSSVQPGDNVSDLTNDAGYVDAAGAAAAAPVQSVNGYTGSVSLAAYDVGAATAAQGALADSAVQPDDLAAVATSGAYSDLSGLPTLGTAAATDASDYATAAQGALADTALQPGANISTLTNDAGFLTDAPSDGQQYARKDGGWVVVAGGGGGGTWGSITGTLADQTDLKAALDAKEPAIAAGTSAQFWRGDKTFANALIGPMGAFPGNTTAGAAAICYEVGTDVAGRGAAIKSVRGSVSTLTGMTFAVHNASGLVDVLTLNDDTTAQFGSTLYIDPVNGRVGVGTLPTNYQFEVKGPTGGLSLSRTGGLEPFILLDDAGTTAGAGGQIRGLITGGLRLTQTASGQPTMLQVTSTQVRPGFDNAATSGAPSFRWSVVYAATGSINTSDAREKTEVTALSDAELAAAIDLSRAIGTYQWLASVQSKGAAARLHVGLTVQRAIGIMQAHGLDPFRYGFICYDQWDEQAEMIDQATGEVSQPYEPAGDRYSFRHDELLLFIARGVDARLGALEATA